MTNVGPIWVQKTVRLPALPRGCHLITQNVVDACPELASLEVGLLQVFLLHTSAALTLNENADPDVRVDMEMALSRIVPEDFPYVHTLEGPDDMPAHVKSSLFGASVTVPISAGRLCLGTWQGIYVCEHRDRASRRSLVLTAVGQGKSNS
jgi:secondary thiamine-phosphate synthase enzyme